MSHKLYDEPKDAQGKGSWYQLALKEGYYYIFRHSDGYYHCICKNGNHTAQKYGRFVSAKGMEEHLRGKGGKAPAGPYMGPEPMMKYKVSIKNLHE